MLPEKIKISNITSSGSIENMSGQMYIKQMLDGYVMNSFYCIKHVWACTCVRKTEALFSVWSAGLWEELLSAWALRLQDRSAENANALPERRVAPITRQQCKHEFRGGRARVSQGYIHFCSYWQHHSLGKHHMKYV